MRILIVSPAYAPYAGVGANRMMSLSKHLADGGHIVTVLRNTPELWPAHTLKSIPPDNVSIVDVFVSGSFNSCVDAYYNAISSVYKEQSFDCAVYSCNPYYTIVAAARIKTETGAPYIIDFRDLWIKDEALTRSIPRRIKKFINRLPYRNKERLCIKNADHIVTVTPKDCLQLQKQYPQFSYKISTIYNGYDENRINIVLPEKELDIIKYILKEIGDYHTIGVFGKLGYYDYKYACELLNAVKHLNNNGIKTKILHIGDLDNKTKAALKDTSFPDNLYYGTGFLDYTVSMSLLQHVNLNCLIVHYKRGLGTKLFDYIYLDKPIIYFAQKDSAIAEILQTCTNAYPCQNTVDAVKAIKRITDGSEKTLGCDNPQKYSRSTQNEHYEQLIKTMVNNK